MSLILTTIRSVDDLLEMLSHTLSGEEMLLIAETISQYPIPNTQYPIPNSQYPIAQSQMEY